MLDGAVARASGTVTKFGGFLDSTIDRYSESLVYGGVLVYLLGTGLPLGSLLIIVATAGSLLISYARARAEAAGFRASVGLLARSACSSSPLDCSRDMSSRRCGFSLLAPISRS